MFLSLLISFYSVHQQPIQNSDVVDSYMIGFSRSYFSEGSTWLYMKKDSQWAGLIKLRESSDRPGALDADKILVFDEYGICILSASGVREEVIVVHLEPNDMSASLLLDVEGLLTGSVSTDKYWIGAVYSKKRESSKTYILKVSRGKIQYGVCPALGSQEWFLKDYRENSMLFSQGNRTKSLNLTWHSESKSWRELSKN